MNTLLLSWNPSSDNYKSESFVHDIEAVHNGDEVLLRWKLKDIDFCNKGDRFYMINTNSHGNRGICMVGYLYSTPFKDDDGSGLCTNLDPLTMVDVDACPFISLDRLAKVIPDIDWFNLPNGLLLNEVQTVRIEELWLQYIYKHQNMYDGIKASQAWDFDLENFETVTPALQECYLKTRGNKCEKCGKRPDEVNEMAYHIVLDGDYSGTTPLEKMLHCYCNECWF